MYFSIEPERIRLERMMTLIPHFSPRTSGLIVPISEGAPAGANHRMLMQDTMRYIRSPDFRKRFQDYQSKKESAVMTYRGIRHKTQFEKELQRRKNPTAAMLCSLYLLTADCRLWSQVRQNVHAAGIRFQNIKLGGISPEAYALFMTAKDLYCGTKHITVRDLADTELVSPQLFGILCEAMTIRRYGQAACIAADNQKEGQ